MIIPLIFPLFSVNPSLKLHLSKLYLDKEMLSMEKHKDSRFKLLKHFLFLKKLDHLNVIKFLSIK